MVALLLIAVFSDLNLEARGAVRRRAQGLPAEPDRPARRPALHGASAARRRDRLRPCHVLISISAGSLARPAATANSRSSRFEFSVEGQTDDDLRWIVVAHKAEQPATYYLLDRALSGKESNNAIQKLAKRLA